MPRRHISNLRSKSAFRRRPGQREPRSITLIVCEGETEQAYFEAVRILFQLTTAEVVVADNTRGAAPISVVECAEEKAAEQGGYDTIFCVFDRDGHESFDRARARIRGLAAPEIDLTCTRLCRLRASNSGFFSISSGPIDPSRDASM